MHTSRAPISSVGAGRGHRGGSGEEARDRVAGPPGIDPTSRLGLGATTRREGRGRAGGGRAGVRRAGGAPSREAATGDRGAGKRRRGPEALGIADVAVSVCLAGKRCEAEGTIEVAFTADTRGRDETERG